MNTRSRLRDWFRSFFDDSYLSVLKSQFDERVTARQARFVEKVLDLKPGMRILDVGCGYGRHAAAFARRGYEVTAVDLSPAMLAEALRRWRRVPNLAFVRGDMRRLPYRNEFDAVVCLFTTFGYFNARGNRQTLRGMARALRPGGRLLIETRDLTWARRHPVRRGWWTFGRSGFVLEEAAIASARGTAEARWRIIDLAAKRSPTAILSRRFRVQLHTRAGWKRVFRDVGLVPGPAFGGWGPAGPPPGPGPRLIVTARRPRA